MWKFETMPFRDLREPRKSLPRLVMLKVRGSRNHCFGTKRWDSLTAAWGAFRAARHCAVSPAPSALRTPKTRLGGLFKVSTTPV
jgi:hypothetical protein